VRDAISLTTAGESHGPAVTAILTGMPSGLAVSAAHIDRDLARRQVGYGRGGRMHIEQDRARILGGIRHGRTLGSPVCLMIENRDWANWQDEMSAEAQAEGWTSAREVRVPRPGHADLAGGAKYGHVDMRNVLERASARETAGRVAGGAVCRQLLAEFGVAVRSRTISIGGVSASWVALEDEDWGAVEASDMHCADEESAEGMRQRIDEARDAGDSLGGVVEVVATDLPPGLGSYVSWQDRLDGRLAQALMSVPAMKGVEIGGGFESAGLAGSEVHDPIGLATAPEAGQWWVSRSSNNAGGLEGGVTNGEPVVARVAMKPIPTLMQPLASVDVVTGEATEAHAERSDVCAVPAAGVVCEAMMALVLASAMREKLGGDCVADMRAAWSAYMGRLGLPWRDADPDG